MKSQELHRRNLKRFAIVLLAAQIVVIVLYGVFVRFTVQSGKGLNVEKYPMYQDVNVMMLIGFGFLMTFVRHHTISALAYTFMLNAVIVQYYILLSALWQRVFTTGFHSLYINIDEKSFIAASYSVASILIAFGAVLGRVGPIQLLLMGLVQVVGYSLNEALVYHVIKAFDVGGSMPIHIFGAYFGLTVSFIISKQAAPVGKVPTTYNSNAFAFIGTLFLWMYWPSFNAGYFPNTDYQKTQIIVNTILSLTASCLAAFMFSAINKDRLQIEDILNATLAGGVAIGAPAGLLYHPAGALTIGFGAGLVSTLGFHKLTTHLNSLGFYDTCGVHNLHGMPGLLGGILSAVVIASYSASGTIDPAVVSPTYLPFYSTIGSFYRQGGLQILATFCSLLLAIFFGIIAGLLLTLVYQFTPSQFYKDNIYFELDQQSNNKFNQTQDIVNITKEELK